MTYMDVTITKSKKKDKKYDAIIEDKKIIQKSLLVLVRLAILILLNIRALREKNVILLDIQKKITLNII